MLPPPALGSAPVRALQGPGAAVPTIFRQSPEECGQAKLRNDCGELRARVSRVRPASPPGEDERTWQKCRATDLPRAALRSWRESPVTRPIAPAASGPRQDRERIF